MGKRLRGEGWERLPPTNHSTLCHLSLLIEWKGDELGWANSDSAIESKLCFALKYRDLTEA